MDKLLLRGESKVVEYKQEYSKTLLKTVSAFANYHDGFVVLGVSDSGEILGVHDPAETRLSLENAINAGVEPRVFYEITSEELEGKCIVILKVYKGDYTPYTVNNKAFKRMDTSTVPIDRYAHEELILQGRNLSFEELVCDLQSPEFNNLSRRMKQSLKIHDFSEDLLITLGLKSSNKYNNAAALLSDENPIQHAAIQLIAYAGTSVLEIKDRQSLDGISILQQFDDCMSFYRKHINVQEVIEGPYRKTVEEVPLVAYREAVANAIVHRDYLRKSDIRIEFFVDRVEITSPGGLPIGISEEEYYEGRVSVPRNRIVADIFLKLKIIEKLATGVRRIKEYYRDHSAKPGFRVYENSILVTLPMICRSGNDSEQMVLEKPDSLADQELLICKAIGERGSVSRAELERELGLKKSQTSDIIARLRSRKLIAQVGKGRETRYVIRS